MKRIAGILLIVGLLTVAFALPVAASSADMAQAEADATEEALLPAEDGSIEIEDEETPLAGLPGMTSSDVSWMVTVAGIVMVAVAGVILVIGGRREHAHR